MISLTAFLVEAPTEDKLKTLEHPEDHLIKSGEAGFHHAFNTLKTTAETLQGHDTGTRIRINHDGSPSIVFGRNPENGQFFVAHGQAMGKNPKINYTDADIEKNHGTSASLASNLKAALKHLPKIAPKAGVFQGDLLYNKANNDVTQDEKGNYSFRPKLVQYQAKKGSDQANAIARAKIGIHVHTGFKGTDLATMKPNHAPDTAGFKPHPDVHTHLWNTGFDAKKAKYSDADHAQFKSEMNKAGKLLTAADRHELFGAAHGVKQADLETYINKATAHGVAPSADGLSKHLGDKDTRPNKRHLNTLLQMYQHLQNAKNALTPALQRGDVSGYKYSVNGQDSAGAGAIAITKENRPTKLINRSKG